MISNIATAPELNWLKANSVNATPEGVDTVDKEFKRTWCSIELFNAVVTNDYNAFSACQPETFRITRKSFAEIRFYVLSVLKTDEDKNAMRAYLVINDLGKVEDFVQKIASSLGFESVDHDKILFEGLKASLNFLQPFWGWKTSTKKLFLQDYKQPLIWGSIFNVNAFQQILHLSQKLMKQL